MQCVNFPWCHRTFPLFLCGSSQGGRPYGQGPHPKDSGTTKWRSLALRQRGAARLLSEGLSPEEEIIISDLKLYAEDLFVEEEKGENP